MLPMVPLPPIARPVAYRPPAGPLVSAETCLAEVVVDVTTRLRPVCAGMPAEDFAALVRAIASFNLRWAVRDGHLAPRDGL